MTQVVSLDAYLDTAIAMTNLARGITDPERLGETIAKARQALKTAAKYLTHMDDAGQQTHVREKYRELGQAIRRLQRP